MNIFIQNSFIAYHNMFLLEMSFCVDEFYLYIMLYLFEYIHKEWYFTALTR